MTAMTASLKSPFPYFGGKAKIAPLVWRWLGDPKFYIEPFLGSAAVLLSRPGEGALKQEIVNDRDCLLSNFWRAVKYHPDEVAEWAAHPHTFVDMHARRRAALDWRAKIPGAMLSDPVWCDPKIAGYWLYVQRMWIGSNCWDDTESQKVFKLCNGGRPRSSSEMRELMEELSSRLRNVLVYNGDWKVTLGGRWQTSSGSTCGVFFDPPYNFEMHEMTDAYSENEASVSMEVEEWCAANGDRDGMRIVLCGYEDEHDGLLNRGWRKYEWQTGGGYSRCRRDLNEFTLGLQNSMRERCWLSPNCLDGEGNEDADLPLFNFREEL